MAINPQNLMPQLSQVQPLPALQFAGGGAGGGKMEREKLRLMREQFEETRRRNQADEELRRLSEAGEARRAELMLQKEREQAAAQALAEQKKLAESAYGDIYKAGDGSDYAGMVMAGERLNQHGGLFRELGRDAQGRPSFRILPDAADYGERVSQRDAVSHEMQTQAPEGSVWLPPDVAQQATLSRLNAMGLGNIDREGVVDMGAMADQRRAQLAPQLESYRQSLPPGDYRRSAEASSEAALLAGLSPAEGMKLFQSLNKDSGGTIGTLTDDLRDDQKLELDRERFGLEREKFDWEKSKTGADKPLTRMEEKKLRKLGSSDADKAFTNRQIKAKISLQGAAAEAKRVLSNPDPNDDEKAVNFLMELNAQVGAQSERDAARMTGEDKSSFLQKVDNFITSIRRGGYSETLRKSMTDFVESMETRNQAELYSYIDDMKSLSQKEKDALVAQGIQEFVEANVPGYILEKYTEAHGEEEKDDAEQGKPTGFNMEEDARKSGQPTLASVGGEVVDALSEAFTQLGVAAEEVVPKLLPLINYESGGNPQAANPKSSAKGLIQFLDEVAQSYGFKDSAEFSALSAAEQAPYVARYLVDRGIDAASSIGDIYVAIAAPRLLNAKDDAVAYRKDAATKRERDSYENNPDWDTDKDGKITRGELAQLGESKGKKAAKKQPEGVGLVPVGEGAAPPGPRAARERAAQSEEPESAEDGIPDTRPRVKAQEQKPAKKAGKDDEWGRRMLGN